MVARRSPKPKVGVQILLPMPRGSGEDGESHRTVNPALNRLIGSNPIYPTNSCVKYSMIKPITSSEYKLFADDPVRPHIKPEFRTSEGRHVFVLYEDQYAEQAPVMEEGPRAVICVAFTDEVPTCEDDLNTVGDKVAVFYTVWSYSKGAGREIVIDTAKHLKQKYPSLERFVTLSPLTEMAERFHLRNGAKFLARYDDCQNFEYNV